MTSFLILILTSLWAGGHCSQHSRNLYSEIFKSGKYNKLIRPVGDNTDKLVVSVGLRLISIIDVDEKNQIMTTNVWLEQTWKDYKLQWEPERYGNVKKLYVPPDVIWLPDIILYNSADGNFTINVMTKATIHHTGTVSWSPPAVYKSLCLIDVEFFPFDQQMCILKIGSWSYDGNLVDIKHNQLPEGADELQTIQDGINLTDYGPSTEWDLLAVPSKKFLKYYPCCSEAFPDLKFHITIRRKTLYHTVNLILPCVTICGLTVFVFFVPALSGEKITMAITILNSLNIFLLLVAEINPPTSLATPLIGKYLLFTMVLVTCSIIVTVFVLNVHFRSPSTHQMSPLVRKLFLETLPKLLFMQRPGDKRKELQKRLKISTNSFIMTRKSIQRKKPEEDVTSLIKEKRVDGRNKRGQNLKDSAPKCQTKTFDSLGKQSVKIITVNNPKYNYYYGPDDQIKETNIDGHKDRKYSGKVRFETGNSVEAHAKKNKHVARKQKAKEEYDNRNYKHEKEEEDYEDGASSSDDSDTSSGESNDSSDDDSNDVSSVSEIWFQHENLNDPKQTNKNNKNKNNKNKNNKNKKIKNPPKLPAPLMQAVVGVNFIADHIKEQDASEKIKEDWKFISVVMDRLFMWIFAAFCCVGTCSIILQAPMLYDTRPAIG